MMFSTALRDNIADESPSPSLSGNSEPASNGVLIGVLITLFLLLLLAAAVVTALISYYFYSKQRSSSKGQSNHYWTGLQFFTLSSLSLPTEINPFNVTNLGRMNVTDNPTYLPADDLVPDDDALEKAPANGHSSSAEPVYASTAVKYPSMVPIIGSAAYDTLATSHDNLLTPYSSYDKLGSSPDRNGKIVKGHTTGAGTVLHQARNAQQGGTIVNPYASVDLGTITGSEIDLHNSSIPSNNSRGEYDQLEKA